MWEVGDKIVCIDNKYLRDVLEIGKVYTLSTVNRHDKHDIQIKEFGNGWFSDIRFKLLVDFRKEKINKIKERICLK